MTTVSLTITAIVTDAQALWDSAVTHGICEGLYRTAADAEEFLGPRDAPDIGECLRSLLEPQSSPTGCEIQDSVATIETA